MATTIKLKNSVTTTNTPSSLAQGEVAINITDKKVWVGNAATTPVQLLGDGGSATFSSITVTGVSTFSAGTVSAPSITTSGDTNTGIFFPAADTIAFTEGGAEAMRIDSSGNVGIGTSSPSQRLDVAGSTSGGYVVQILRNTNSGGYAQQIFQIGSANGTANIAYAPSIFFALGPSANDTTTPIVFQNNNATERMRIDSTGNVGIGTSSPAARLDVVASDARFNLTSTGSGQTVGISIKGGAGGGDTFNFIESLNSGGTQAWYLGSNGTANTLAFKTNGNNERMRIDSSGNVLVGSTTNFAGSKLYVNNSITTDWSGLIALRYNVSGQTNSYFKGMTGLSITDNSSARGLHIFNYDSDSNQGIRFYPNSYAGQTANPSVTITSGGNLLVGQSSLDANAGGALFQLTQNNANWIHYVTNSGSSGNIYGAAVKFNQQSPNNTSSGFFSCNDSTLERLRIYANGGIANYSANNVNLSDAREKTNIELAGSYLDKICAIPVKTFNYIDQNLEEDDGLTLGVIAQDVQEVAPELVMESKWASKDEPEKMRLSIYQTDLQYALMKSIQELKAIVDAQAAEIALLKSK